jgi:hypothetical protein
MERRIKGISKYSYIPKREKPISTRKQNKILKKLGTDQEINTESKNLSTEVKKYENLIASKKTALVPIVSHLSHKFDEYNEYQDKRREIIESLKTGKITLSKPKKEKEIKPKKRNL